MSFNVERGLLAAGAGAAGRYEGMLRSDREAKAEQRRLEAQNDREESMYLFKKNADRDSREQKLDDDFKRSQSPEMLAAQEAAEDRERVSGVKDQQALIDAARADKASPAAVAEREAMQKEREANLKNEISLKNELSAEEKLKQDKAWNEQFDKVKGNMTDEQILAVQLQRAGIDPKLMRNDSGVKQLTQDQWLTQLNKFKERTVAGLDLEKKKDRHTFQKAVAMFTDKYEPRGKAQTPTQDQKAEAKRMQDEAAKLIDTPEKEDGIAKSIAGGDREDQQLVRFLPIEQQRRIKSMADMYRNTVGEANVDVDAPTQVQTPRLQAGQTKRQITSEMRARKAQDEAFKKNPQTGIGTLGFQY